MYTEDKLLKIAHRLGLLHREQLVETAGIEGDSIGGDDSAAPLCPSCSEILLARTKGKFQSLHSTRNFSMISFCEEIVPLPQGGVGHLIIHPETNFLGYFPK